MQEPVPVEKEEIENTEEDGNQEYFQSYLEIRPV
jgi:hypothetical protein